MLLLFLLKVGFAQLVVRSPPAISDTVLDFTISNFGSPGYFALVGKLYFITISNNCSLSSFDLSNQVALIYLNSTCYYSSIALEAQTQGANCVIFVNSNDNLDFIISAEDLAKGQRIIIPVISIGASSWDFLKNYMENIIWVTYSYGLVQANISRVEFCMSGNYSLDKVYGNQLIQAYTDLGSSALNFTPTISYTDSSSVGVNASTDCVTESMCIPGNGKVKGSDMLKNSFLIYDYFLNATYASFFSFLSELYINCEFNYSQNCISSLLPINSSQVTYYIPKTYDFFQEYYITPLIFVNSIPTFWPSSLEFAICISSLAPSSACPTCASGCSYPLLYSQTCSYSCNTSSCGYGSLSCIESNGCFDFMLGDGQCSAICPNDPDCLSSNSSECSSGCSYSDMAYGLCPYECTGSCFSNCNQNIYCSPGCLYGDLKAGFCSTNCSDICLAECDLNPSNCPRQCKNSNEQSDSCLAGCPSSCCGQIGELGGDDNTSTVMIIIIVVCIAGILVGIIFVFFCKYIKQRRNQAMGAYNGTSNNGENRGCWVIKLKPVKFEKGINFVGDSFCTIDLAGLSEGEKVVVTPCQHIFHAECLKEWLEAIGRDKKCPNCNLSLLNIDVLIE